MEKGTDEQKKTPTMLQVEKCRDEVKFAKHQTELDLAREIKRNSKSFFSHIKKIQGSRATQ